MTLTACLLDESWIIDELESCLTHAPDDIPTDEWLRDRAERAMARRHPEIDRCVWANRWEFESLRRSRFAAATVIEPSIEDWEAVTTEVWS